MTDIRYEIKSALNSFDVDDVRNSSLHLLNILGYTSEKINPIPNANPQALLDLLNEVGGDESFDQEKALFAEWKAADLLFQLTDDELGSTLNLFQTNEVKAGLFESYIFFVIQLKNHSYPRGKLAQITRKLNRVFPMPVMVFFVYDARLSIAIINRRHHKRDISKDVLGKVTLIQDINLAQPHRGHLEILASLSFEGLGGSRSITSFDELHRAWSEVLNIELLNKKFYQRIAEWFFFAVHQVRFPDGGVADEQQRNRIAVIRLLTRIIFCWFAKEKGLIPEAMFEESFAKKCLNDFDPETSEKDSYYKAILQNLFFPTLSIPIDERKLRTERRFHGKNKHYMDHSRLRYAALFKDVTAPVELFEKIPFLNGGLFECLDYRETRGAFHCEVRVDGFSDHPKNPLHVPDALFFGREMAADLSAELGKKKASAKIDGLIHILNDYKFTVTENTPIEEEIALDPELLGRIFENLLAEYNPETEKTARKETGSFYTPRTIVDYMVNESLKAYLSQKLTEKLSNVTAEDAQVGLDILFAYTEKEHPFTAQEQQALVDAIYDIKVLDPACGSGAFPIGTLQKLLYVLDKLDHHHDRWKERILHDTPAAMRDETRKLLDRSSAEYSWKLGLIQNCIYGIDIQPIAVQIAKLRCFISLLVDFEIKTDEENSGVPALPNLAFKFVAADSLIKPPGEAEEGLFSDPFFERFAQATEDFFFVKSPKEKTRLREQIESLIEEKIDQNEKTLAQQRGTDLAVASHRKELAKRNQAAVARQEYEIALWESYRNLFARRNDFVRFFDIRYFFPEVKTGFDILIGNPPYKQIQTFPKDKKDEWVAQNFKTYAASGDIYCLFYERGAKLLKPGGHLCYITSNKWMRADYGEALREFLATQVNTTSVLDFGMAQNFGSATTYTCILHFNRQESVGTTQCCYAADDRLAMADPEGYFEQNAVVMDGLGGQSWVMVSPQVYRIKQLVAEQGVPLKEWDINIYRGVLTGLNEAFYLTQAERDELVASEPHAEKLLVPLLRGRHVKRWRQDWDGTWLIATFPSQNINIEKYPKLMARLSLIRKKLEPKPLGYKGGSWGGRKTGSYEWYEIQDTIAYKNEFLKNKIIYQEIAQKIPFFYDETGTYTNDTCYIITGDRYLKYLLSLLNSHLFRACFKDNFPVNQGNAYRVKKVFFEKIPIKKPVPETADFFDSLVTAVQLAKRWIEGVTPAPKVVASFLEEVIDACVMEIYFAEHMRERKLDLMDHVRPLLPVDLDSLNEADQWRAVVVFFEQANAPDHTIRNRLMRITSDSPDLLAVIKKEGKV